MPENPYDVFPQLRESRRLVAKALEGKEFDSVLEVGSQWGENLLAIKEKFPDKKLVGVDIDIPTTTEAKNITGLDLREGNLFNLEFKDGEFDVVFTNAVFCMVHPGDVKKGIEELIRVAKKYIILVELKCNVELTNDFLGGQIDGNGRVCAYWVDVFKKYGFEATEEKIPKDVWEGPWVEHGFVYTVNVSKK